jgi:hypothetical protein
MERECIFGPVASQSGGGSYVATINDNQSSSTLNPGILFGGRNFEVVFPLAWDGGNIIISGKDRDGSTISENFINPGVGGGTVIGSKIFWKVIAADITNTIVAGVGAKTVFIYLGEFIGLKRANITFLDIRDYGGSGTITPTALDEIAGWVSIGALNGSNILEILYIY